jgi:hypothetical protein
LFIKLLSDAHYVPGTILASGDPERTAVALALREIVVQAVKQETIAILEIGVKSVVGSYRKEGITLPGVPGIIVQSKVTL